MAPLLPREVPDHFGIEPSGGTGHSGTGSITGNRAVGSVCPARTPWVARHRGNTPHRASRPVGHSAWGGIYWPPRIVAGHARGRGNPRPRSRRGWLEEEGRYQGTTTQGPANRRARARCSVRGKARHGVMRRSRRIGGKGDSTDGSGLGGEVGSCLEGHRIATTAYEAVGQMGRYKMIELAGRAAALRLGVGKQPDSGTNAYESSHFPAHHRPRH